MAGHGKVGDEVEAVQTPRSCVACRSVQDGLEQISVGACIGERENEFAVGRIEIEKYPIIFDMAVTESLKVARKRMVSVLWRQGFAHGKFENDIIDLVDVFAAPDHLLQAFAKAFRLEYSVLHASRNSLSLAGSSQYCAFGSLISSFAALYASTSRWCLLFRASVKGIPPTSRILAKKQLKAVDIFMPMSSRISSTSALSSASVRNVMLVVIDCTPIVSRNAYIVPYIIALCNMSAWVSGSPSQYQTSGNARMVNTKPVHALEWYRSSTTRKRLAPSIYSRNEARPLRINLKCQLQNISFNHVEHVDRVEVLHVSTRSTWLIIFGKRALQVPLQIAEGANLLKGVLHRQNFDAVFPDAIIHPPISVLAENLSVLRTLHIGERFKTDFGVWGNGFRGTEYIVFKCDSIFWIEVGRDIQERISKANVCAFSPVRYRIHCATFSFCVRFLELLREVSFFNSSSSIRLTSSCVYTSPRSDSPSPTRMSSYSSALYSFSVIFSHSSAERNTEVARPFCVRIIGRCVSAVRATQSASVLRNSLIEMMSSVGLKSSMFFSPLVCVRDIVRNRVHNVKQGDDKNDLSCQYQTDRLVRMINTKLAYRSEWYRSSTTRKRLAPSIRLRNQLKDIGSKVK